MIHGQFEAFTITQAADGRICSDRSMPLGVLSETTQHVYKRSKPRHDTRSQIEEQTNTEFNQNYNCKKMSVDFKNTKNMTIGDKNIIFWENKAFKYLGYYTLATI